ncbi:acetyl-CoA carboxylase, carboxyltransferase subunit beta [Chlamydiales bacterium]|nr:acetyl-CoA carboxylase, carboxyltransferase subunit beta [Chlamydiales bacterium]
MGLFSREKPKIKIQTTKKDGFSGWLKCTQCVELIHVNELKQNQNCCPKCNYHYRLSAKERIESLADAGSFVELFKEVKTKDPLNFIDSIPYKERIKIAQEKSGNDEAALTGRCTIADHLIYLAVFDFTFMGGSMGSVVGEKLTRMIEEATETLSPVIIVSTSGGARMQESILSLMQMAKTSAALAKLSEAKVPYISILTNPTTGGVTASFASLGDVILAEPNALIGFAGTRIIEQTIGQKLPIGAQKSEFLLEHGMIDSIVTRKELKNKISEILGILNG